MDKHLLEAKIRYQVACEEKAHHLVLQLLEPEITEDELVNAVGKHYLYNRNKNTTNLQSCNLELSGPQ